MNCFDKRIHHASIEAYKGIWSKTDFEIPSVKNLLSHLEYDAEYDLIVDTDGSSKYTEHTGYPVLRWYRSTTAMKRISKILMNTIPDVLEDVFNSVKPDSQYPLNDVGNMIAEMYKSGKIDKKKIIDAFYKEYSTNFGPPVPRDAFETEFHTSDAPFNINEVQAIATFIYLLRSSKLDKDTTLYSGYEFSNSKSVPKVGDMFEAKTPLCTSLSPSVAFRFHKGSGNMYYDVFQTQIPETDKFNFVRAWANSNRQKNKSFILVFKMKSGDGAFKSSNVLGYCTSDSTVKSELEYTLPPSKFKVSKIDTEHMWIELEPVR